MSKQVWYVGSPKGVAIGIYTTEQGAIHAMNTMYKDMDVDKQVFSRPAMECPTCGRLDSKENIMDLGECIRCDHIRADAMDDMMADAQQRGGVE